MTNVLACCAPKSEFPYFLFTLTPACIPKMLLCFAEQVCFDFQKIDQNEMRKFRDVAVVKLL